MRFSSLLVSVAAVSGSAYAATVTSTAVPVQQIGDGQIQNPVTPPAVPETSYAPAPPASSAPAPPASSAPAPVASSAPSPSEAYSSALAPPAPPAFGNVTATVTGQKTITSSVIKPSTAASGAASATSSKPVVQTGAANSMVGSTVGLGLAAIMAALLG